jgi:SAM-dependent methyltransferase
MTRAMTRPLPDRARRLLRAWGRQAERISPFRMSPGDPDLRLHVERYRFACERLRWDDVVLDAACGCGYGSALLSRYCHMVVGIDNDPAVLEEAERRYGTVRTVYLEGNLDAVRLPRCDVAVSFATAEHLERPWRFVTQLKACARRVIYFSVPIVPTTGRNPFHLHDFTAAEVRGWFTGSGWQIVREIAQTDPRQGAGPCHLVLEVLRTEHPLEEQAYACA